MDLSKYPVTTAFGYVAGYPLNGGFHNGIDYGLPMNTPVIVNGVEIAHSNNTGASTGPHLHIGKYSGGAAQNPGVGAGTRFKSAVVNDTGHDSVNGNYVRINADGALWNYLHLADGSIKVRAGQVLNGSPQGVLEPMITKEMEMSEAYKATGSYPGINYSYPFVGGTDYNGMLSFWQGQMTLISATDEKRVAEGATGIPNVIGDGYNSQFVGKPAVSHYSQMADFWNAQPKAAGAGSDPNSETNVLGKALLAVLNKLGYKKS